MAKTISMSMRSQIQIIFNQNNETYTYTKMESYIMIFLEVKMV